ncbi:MAG: thioesterase family protein [Acidimicrobiales bacterium]
MTNPEALFFAHGDVLHPTALTRGPWADHGFLHGSAVCGALGWATEQTVGNPALALARFTVEIRSMVPCQALHTTAAVVKAGRRSQVVEAALHHEGRVVARATSQWVAHHTDGSVGGSVGASVGASGVVARPEQASDPGAHPDMVYPRPGFNCDAVELRPIRSTTEDEGPGLIWVRLRHPVVAGQPASPTLAMMTLSDFGIAVGWQRSPAGADFINADVTLQLNRPPLGPWVLFASRVHASAAGYGFCETVLADDAGLFGRILQSLVEAPPTLGSPGQG